MKIEYENGYPTKKSINKLIVVFGIRKSMITFCADYGSKKAGFLWYNNSVKKDMQKFVSFMKWNNILIQHEKYQGTINSIWLKKNNDYI